MFETKFIKELLGGKLSEKGYCHILGTISYMVSKHAWPRTIVASNIQKNAERWQADEIRELSHLFFEWVISKGKLNYISKVPEHYLSYYFSQILVSFVSEQIKLLQKETGLSYEKCRQLVSAIAEEEFYQKEINGKLYLSLHDSFSISEFKSEETLLSAVHYIHRPVVSKSTKHYKPLVKLVMHELMDILSSPVTIDDLTSAIFELFNDQNLPAPTARIDFENEPSEINSTGIASAVQEICTGISWTDAQIILLYIFQREGEVSIRGLSDRLALSKSTTHARVEQLKKKIIENYNPENEQDGIFFLEQLGSALDKKAK